MGARAFGPKDGPSSTWCALVQATARFAPSLPPVLAAVRTDYCEPTVHAIAPRKADRDFCPRTNFLRHDSRESTALAEGLAACSGLKCS